MPSASTFCPFSSLLSSSAPCALQVTERMDHARARNLETSERSCGESTSTLCPFSPGSHSHRKRWNPSSRAVGVASAGVQRLVAVRELSEEMGVYGEVYRQVSREEAGICRPTATISAETRMFPVQAFR